MKKITNSVYTFEELIKDGLCGQKQVHLESGRSGQENVLPRPAAPLWTVSTLMAVFEGKKELFKGLAIYDKPYDWKPYPVILLDMRNCSTKTPKELKLYLTRWRANPQLKSLVIAEFRHRGD